MLNTPPGACQLTFGAYSYELAGKYEQIHLSIVFTENNGLRTPTYPARLAWVSFVAVVTDHGEADLAPASKSAGAISSAGILSS